MGSVEPAPPRVGLPLDETCPCPWRLWFTNVGNPKRLSSTFTQPASISGSPPNALLGSSPYTRKPIHRRCATCWTGTGDSATSTNAPPRSSPRSASPSTSMRRRWRALPNLACAMIREVDLEDPDSSGAGDHLPRAPLESGWLLRRSWGTMPCSRVSPDVSREQRVAAFGGADTEALDRTVRPRAPNGTQRSLRRIRDRLWCGPSFTAWDSPSSICQMGATDGCV